MRRSPEGLVRANKARGSGIRLNPDRETELWLKLRCKQGKGLTVQRPDQSREEEQGSDRRKTRLEEEGGSAKAPESFQWGPLTVQTDTWSERQ